jgi:hypothetical protein
MITNNLEVERGEGERKNEGFDDVLVDIARPLQLGHGISHTFFGVPTPTKGILQETNLNKEILPTPCRATHYQ